MARYDNEHKGATRQRIVDTAGHRLKTDGIDGSGVATLMKDAGLTNGAFYAHFASKDELVATTITAQLHAQHAQLTALTPGPDGIEQFARAYLSREHRDNPGDGCPSAALLGEIRRCDHGTREAYSAGISAVVDIIASHVQPENPAAIRTHTFAAVASMIGTLQLSRALTDPNLADALLEQGIDNAIRLFAAAATEPAPQRPDGARQRKTANR